MICPSCAIFAPQAFIVCGVFYKLDLSVKERLFVDRLAKLPPYLFSAIDEARDQALAQGVQVVDLGVGDPDRPTPDFLVQAMITAVQNPACHQYPAGRGSQSLRQTIAAWLQKRYAVTVDPDTEVLVLVGSKEGLGHLPLSCVQEGDNTLVPDLGYPVYGEATLLAGGQPRTFALTAENGFLPDGHALAETMDERTRLLFLNYPNNPTGAVAHADFWRQMADLTEANGVTLVNDAAYMEVLPEGGKAVSLLEVVDHRQNKVLELHSLSKMFNMTGWRIAFAVGHKEVVGKLARVKQSMDSGVFTAVQKVAEYALGEAFDTLLADVTRPYAKRRTIIVKALEQAGFDVFPSPATFYVWARVPDGESSMSFCSRALNDIGVVLTPGVGFGTGGEGWFRVSLTASDADIAEGAGRLREWK